MIFFGLKTLQCVKVLFCNHPINKALFHLLQGVRMRAAIVTQQTLPPLHMLPSVFRQRHFDGRKDRTGLTVTTAKENRQNN
jgi:hypothetical protein